MKTPILKLIVVSSMVALGAILLVPSGRAGDDKPDTPAERKARREAETLRKYDANHDGKLDDTEKSARKSDREKARAEREAKKREHEEKKAEPDDR
ncbi:MAG: hypothetical protein JWM88_2890 [Verrucomicrobia bacterium]|nr:hypothetical protein [Verrucomicrobiota bacterium]